MSEYYILPVSHQFQKFGSTSPFLEFLLKTYFQKFQRRRKYKLHAAMLNATMVSEIDAPVEFEVSIG